MSYSRYFKNISKRSFKRSFKTLLFITLFQIILVNSLTATEAPKKGMQWLYGGLSLSPGFLSDAAGEDRQVSTLSISQGLAGRFGLLHAIGETFYMRAEFDLGVRYFRPHTAHSKGVYLDDEIAFAWQIGLGGQYLPLGAEGGPAIGLNLNIFRASLEGGSLQTLAPELRLGWYFWKGPKFALLELSYAYPALSGLNAPISFADENENVPQTWTYHQLGVAMTTSF